MIFTKQERLLRISADQLLSVSIYVQEKHVDWLTDVLLQEMLQAVKPKLHDKLAQLLEGKRVASVFTNRAFQIAYYIDQASRSSQVLVQEPLAKAEDAQPDEDKRQFSYTALRATRHALVLVPEPFDPNNAVALPDALEIEIE